MSWLPSTKIMVIFFIKGKKNPGFLWKSWLWLHSCLVPRTGLCQENIPSDPLKTCAWDHTSIPIWWKLSIKRIHTLLTVLTLKILLFFQDLVVDGKLGIVKSVLMWFEHLRQTVKASPLIFGKQFSNHFWWSLIAIRKGGPLVLPIFTKWELHPPVWLRDTSTTTLQFYLIDFIALVWLLKKDDWWPVNF